jgi:hypothetical protein
MSASEIVKEPLNEELQYRLNRLDSNIKAEFDLIGHRMTWLVISQSFLFSAFSLAAANPTGPHVLRILLWLLPSLGTVASITVYLAILAAHSVIRKVKKDRRPLEEVANKKFGLELDSCGDDRWEHVVGNVPSLLIPPAIIIAWIILLSTVFA